MYLTSSEPRRLPSDDAALTLTLGTADGPAESRPTSSTLNTDELGVTS